jgi:hypothetical protein
LDITDSVRAYVNELDELKEGISAPNLEMLPVEEEDKKLYKVQKILTEIYVFTDTDNMKYGSKTFQDVILMGDMTREDVDTLIVKKRRKGG